MIYFVGPAAELMRRVPPLPSVTLTISLSEGSTSACISRFVFASFVSSWFIQHTYTKKESLERVNSYFTLSWMLSPHTTRSGEALSISRVNSRASSREPHTPHTTDPVLARYLQIKRDLDRGGSAVDGPASTPHTTTTPRAAPNNAVSVDARSMLSSPGPGAAIPGWNSRLNERYEARMSRQRDVLREARDPHHSSSLEASAVMGSHDTSTVSAHNARRAQPADMREIEQLAMAVADSEAARARAEHLASQRENEIVHLRKRLLQGDSEPRPHKSAAPRIATPSNSPKPMRPAETALDVSHSRGAEGDDRRQQLLTRGRLEALERVLAEKDERLDGEMQRAQTLERRSHELARQVESLQLALDESQQHLRAGSGADDVTAREVHRLRLALETSQRQVQDERRKLLTWEKGQDDNALAIELLQDRHREELRDLTKRLQEAELRSEGSEAKRSRAEEELIDARRQLDSKSRDLESAEHRLRESSVKLESIKATSAQESIVKDELKYEVERFKKVVSNLRDELVAQEDGKRQLESVLADCRSELESKATLQVQLREAELRNTTLTLQVEALESSLSGANRHLSDAKDDLKKLSAAEEQVAALRAAIHQKELSVESHQVTAADLTREVERLKAAMKEVNAREECVVEELRATQHRLVQEEQRVAEKESTLKQLGDVMSTYEKLRQGIDEKTRYIVQQQDVIDNLRVKNSELDADVETLLGVKRQVDELAVERQRLLNELAHSDAERDDLLRELRSVQDALKEKQKELVDVKELVALQDEKQRQMEFRLAEASRLEADCRQAHQDIALLQESHQRELSKREELQSRLDSREERLAEAHTRCKALEDQITQMHKDVTHSQVEVGRLSVLVETHAKEVSRLEREIDTKHDLVEQVTQELSTTRKELQQAKLELQGHALRERLEGDRSASVAQQAQHVSEECERLRQNVRRLENELQSKDEHLQSARNAAERQRDVGAQLEDARHVILKRDEELRELQYQLKRTLEAEAQHEAGTQVAARLELRIAQLKQQYEKLENAHKLLEQEEASKQRLILEQEREMHRLKDRMTSLLAEIDSEKSRKRSLEERVRELETECQRASALDGQVAGLNLVISQRNKDLEEERSMVSELRSKVRNLNQLQAPPSRGTSPQSNPEAESRLLLSEENLRQTREELRRAQDRVELLQKELAASETRRETMRMELQRLTTEKDREIAEMALKCERAQRLADDAARQQNDTSRTPSTGTGELSRTKTALERSEAERQRVVSELHERSIELEIASENLSTLQSRLRERQHEHPTTQRQSEERTIHIGGAAAIEVSSSAPTSQAHFRASSSSNPGGHWDVAAAEETIQQWRERRRAHQEQERTAQAVYNDQVRSKLQP